MKNLMPLMALCLTILMSCSKDDISSTTTNNDNQTNYFPLAVGNYWVYNQYRVDTLGNETMLTSTDSVYVSKDTTINNKTYYILEGGVLVSHIFSGRIVRSDNAGLYRMDVSNGLESVCFSTKNIGAVLKSDYISVAMGGINTKTAVRSTLVNKVVPRGMFSSHEVVTNYSDASSGLPYLPRDESRFYNASVGLVAGQFFFASSPDTYELRLSRYHLN